MTNKAIIALVAIGIILGCGAGVVLHDTLVSRADAQTKKKWEHMCLSIEWKDLNGEPMRNEIGASGWEMVSTISFISGGTNIFACFKRPLSSGISAPGDEASKKTSAGSSSSMLTEVHEKPDAPISKEEEIREIMTANRPTVISCLAKVYAKGDVTLDVNVDTAGKITGLSIKEDIPEAAKTCISDSLADAQLPSAPEPYHFSFVYKQKK